MVVTHKVTKDLIERSFSPLINAVQGDTNSRAVEFTLTANSVPWDVPEGVTAAVAFRKPDGQKGLYDTLPDGSSAFSIAENKITASLAPEVLTCPGKVYATLVLYDQSLNSLATFPFEILVAPHPAAGSPISNNYYKLQNLDQVNAAYDDLLVQIDQLQQADAQIMERLGAPVLRITVGDDGYATHTSGQIAGAAEGGSMVVLVYGDTLYHYVGRAVEEGETDGPALFESIRELDGVLCICKAEIDDDGHVSFYVHAPETGGSISIIVDSDGYLTTTNGGFDVDDDGYILM